MKKRYIMHLHETFSLGSYCKKWFNVMIQRTSQMALVLKNLPASAGTVRDTGSILGLGRSPGGERSNSIQYSCLENPMDRGAWWTMVHRVPKSQTRLKWLSMHAYIMQKYYFYIWRKIPFPEKDSILPQGFHVAHAALLSVNIARTNHKTTAPSRGADRGEFWKCHVYPCFSIDTENPECETLKTGV